MTEDPRLQIDLRGKLHRHIITVLDADGGRPERINSAFEGAEQWSYESSANPVDLCSTTNLLHGIVSAPGWGEAEFRSSGGESEVRLGRGIPVRFEIIGDGLPTNNEGLSLTVGSPADPARGRPQGVHGSKSKWMEGDWSLTLVLPEPGRYLAWVTVPCDPPPNQEWPKSVTLQFGGKPVFEVEIASGSSEQLVTIEITAAMVKEARERVARGER